jgi:hypothetical protein
MDEKTGPDEVSSVMAKETDPELAAWRRAFQCIIHPYLPMLSTLIEMEDRLAAASGYLHTLEDGDTNQVERALAVATMAIEYTGPLLDHFGIWDSPPVPRPSNLTQARMMVDNVLRGVREQIILGQMALAPTNEEDEQGAGQSALSGAVDHAANAEGCPAEKRLPSEEPELAPLVVDRGTFSVRWGEKSCLLGNTKEFSLIERLNRRPGEYLSIPALIRDVWDGYEAEKNTVQKTVSNLRKKLKSAGIGDVTILAERDHYALKLP